MESTKRMLINLFAGQQWRKRQNRLMDLGEKGREGEMYGESNIETYITICKIDSQWEFAVWLRGLRQGFCDYLEGWDGEGNERGLWERSAMVVPIWLILVDV